MQQYWGVISMVCIIQDLGVFMVMSVIFVVVVNMVGEWVVSYVYI